ncbi:glycosyltransferase [Horticoccus luteus]|uniref:Glycosyltransferase n=1 Tax=Horticoccus luteus TaxID=2862869 RepID=A0A8F9TVZ5_9BACT|nr:glycosyltransferase [Horticoccus luteus]QYM80100.1 glycosyltransferase [Horticoccus luteus]
MPRLLLLLPQLPHDPASGAARSLRTACEFLADAGWSVRALATTATEAAGGDGRTLLAQQGIVSEEHAPNRAIYRHDRPVLTFTDRHGIHTALLDTGRLAVSAWPERHGSQFNRLYARELADFRPDIVFAFGGQPGDVERYRRASAAGVKVVFGLRNHGYYEARWLAELDAVLTCSEFVSARYRERLGLESVALPPPLAARDVIAAEREPIFFVAVNPSVEKGAFFLARLAEEVALRRPDLPMLFIESRGSAGALVRAGLAGGFDLRRHESLMFTPATATPAEIFRGARVLLAPSVWEEPFGRVAAEALVNSVPPIVSDRGGLPEAANGGGFVVPLPADLTLETRTPVGPAAVAPWVEFIEKLADDDAFYAAASSRARAAGESYRPQNLAPRYVEFFERVLASPA